MHELLYYPPDYGSSRGTHSFLSGQQRSIVLTACRGKPLSVSWLARPCGFVRSDVPCVLLWRSRHSCVRSLFPRSSCVANRRADAIRAMPSARALLVASLLTEPPYRCLGPSGNDRYRNRSLRLQTGARAWGLRRSNCPSHGGSFAMNRPPADVFGQALLEDPPHDSNCILSQIAASTESLLAWKLGPGNQRRRTAREKRRLRPGACGWWR